MFSFTKKTTHADERRRTRVERTYAIAAESAEAQDALLAAYPNKSKAGLARVAELRAKIAWNRDLRASSSWS